MSRRLLPWTLIALALGAGVFAISRRAEAPAAKPAGPTASVTTTVPKLVFAPSDRATYEFAASRGFVGEITFGFEIASDGTVRNVATTSEADREVVSRFAADLLARRYEPSAPGTMREPLRLSATFTVGGS